MSSEPLFDRSLVRKRLEGAAPDADFVTPLALADLDERLGSISRLFEAAAILAPRPDALPLGSRSALGPIAFERFSSLTGEDALDPDALRMPRTDYDLIVSVFDLNIIDDVPGFLVQLRRHLRPDGLFMAVALGGDTLAELREAFVRADDAVLKGVTPRVSPFIDVRDAGALMQRAGLALPVADVETHVVRYPAPLALMAELKAMGAANPLTERSRRLATHRLIAEASANYDALAADPDGRVRATLELVWMSGWAPHDNQQKPLQPGSARTSLGDALKSAED